METQVRHTLALLGLLLLTSMSAQAGTIYIPAFRTYGSGSYRPAERNIELLNEMKAAWRRFKIVGVSATAPGENFRLCRGSFPVYSLEKKPYEYALADALARELHSVDLYGGSEAIPIAMELNVFDFSTIGNGKWTIEATFTIANEAPIKITHSFPFPIGLRSGQACSDASFAQHRALQEFLYVLYTDPRFNVRAKKDSPKDAESPVVEQER